MGAGAMRALATAMRGRGFLLSHRVCEMSTLVALRLGGAGAARVTATALRGPGFLLYPLSALRMGAGARRVLATAMRGRGFLLPRRVCDGQDAMFIARPGSRLRSLERSRDRFLAVALW